MKWKTFSLSKVSRIVAVYSDSAGVVHFRFLVCSLVNWFSIFPKKILRIAWRFKYLFVSLQSCITMYAHLYLLNFPDELLHLKGNEEGILTHNWDLRLSAGFPIIRVRGCSRPVRELCERSALFLCPWVSVGFLVND